nr:hypothetical protein [Chondromyces crocatus]
MTVVVVVKVAVDEVVDVILVGDRLVSAAWPVLMVCWMGTTGMGRGTACGVIQGALVDVAIVFAVEVAIVEVVHVIAMADGLVPAVRPVSVLVRVMSSVGHSAFSG